MSGHPAPWPLLDLDVAAMRRAGHQPVPFQQFILKVHSRCNLSCSYCYVYEMADQGWRHLPKRMTRPMAAKVIERVAEHARQHDLPGVEIILHGGEPLLAGSAWLAELSRSLRTHVPAPVNIGVQTNGTLLRPPLLDVLKDLGIRVGVSLDGDAEPTGRNRVYANGATVSKTWPKACICSTRSSTATSTAASCAPSTCVMIRSPRTRLC